MSPSQSIPSACRSASCCSSAPGRTRSRSSTRIRNRRPVERANSHASSAVRRLPTCRSPDGEGAYRPLLIEPSRRERLLVVPELLVRDVAVPRVHGLGAGVGVLGGELDRDTPRLAREISRGGQQLV